MSPTETPNQILKTMDLNAPVSKVWNAIVDHDQFGTWFRVKLEGPFQLGKEAVGKITYAGYEHLTWRVMVTKIEFERAFAFTWHPYAVDEQVDYSKETPTTVEFRLEKIPAGTRLTITETGFGHIPVSRRVEAFRSNEGGWETQSKNIEAYLGKNS